MHGILSFKRNFSVPRPFKFFGICLLWPLWCYGRIYSQFQMKASWRKGFLQKFSPTRQRWPSRFLNTEKAVLKPTSLLFRQWLRPQTISAVRRIPRITKTQMIFAFRDLLSALEVFIVLHKILKFFTFRSAHPRGQQALSECISQRKLTC